MARNFDLNTYETVKERKERFRKDYGDGRITVKLISIENITDYAVFEARVYKDAEDQEKDLPIGVGYAMELRDKELSISNKGTKYESVNYTSWTENAEESSVGRALDNAGYSGSKAPSREEMQKVTRMSNTISRSQTSSTPISEKQLKYANTLISQTNSDREAIKTVYKVASLTELTSSQASDLIEKLNIKLGKPPKADSKTEVVSPDDIPEDL